jgi:hypothetical protein
MHPRKTLNPVLLCLGCSGAAAFITIVLYLDVFFRVRIGLSAAVVAGIFCFSGAYSLCILRWFTADMETRESVGMGLWYGGTIFITTIFRDIYLPERSPLLHAIYLGLFNGLGYGLNWRWFVVRRRDSGLGREFKKQPPATAK